MNNNLKIIIHSSFPTDMEAQWESVQPSNFPFGHYHFLAGLEKTDCIGSRSGWHPAYVTVQHKLTNALLAMLPMYVKSHSYGEYIFDFQWAQITAGFGQAYYPKLIIAIPFTPATGNRFFLASPHKSRDIINETMEYLKTYAKDNHYSSIHILFAAQEEAESLKAHHFFIRHSSQYHWQNEGYKEFDDYLLTLRSQKRKQIKKERKSIINEALDFSIIEGDAVTENSMAIMFEFYLSTTQDKGGSTYLNEEFFKYLGNHFKEYIVLIFALYEGKPIGGALFFKKADTLYGRYWGANRYIPYLHFELCYYKAIEYAISRKLKYFEAGAQGEHKFLRGFDPVTTFSAHWFCHQQLHNFFAEFCQREKQQIKQDMDWLKTMSPKKSLVGIEANLGL
jgi:uncharacterized protein